MAKGGLWVYMSTVLFTAVYCWTLNTEQFWGSVEWQHEMQRVKSFFVECLDICRGVCVCVTRRLLNVPPHSVLSLKLSSEQICFSDTSHMKAKAICQTVRNSIRIVWTFIVVKSFLWKLACKLTPYVPCVYRRRKREERGGGNKEGGNKEGERNWSQQWIPEGM